MIIKTFQTGKRCTTLGLQVHQMGGFDTEKAAAFLQLDKDKFEPVTVIAVGFPDEKRQQTDDFIQRKKQAETGEEIRDFVFERK